MRNNDQAREACLSGEIEAMILRVCRGYGIATLELGMRTWDDPPASDGSIQWLCEQVYSRGVEAGREHCSRCWNLGNTVPTSQEPLVAGASSLSREAAVSVALDGDTRRCCNNPDCGNDWPCSIHPDPKAASPAVPPQSQIDVIRFKQAQNLRHLAHDYRKVNWYGSDGEQVEKIMVGFAESLAGDFSSGQAHSAKVHFGYLEPDDAEAGADPSGELLDQLEEMLRDDGYNDANVVLQKLNEIRNAS